MNKPWKRPAVAVANVVHLPDRVRMLCRLAEEPSPPVAPAGLWSDATKGTALFDVHRVQSRNGLVFVFETFGSEIENAPKEGATVFLQSHWLPSAMTAALDVTAVWEHRVYPDDGEHDHCAFTWETISSYTEVRAGYWCKEHGWVTEQAYFDFIENDTYRLRSHRDA